LNGPLAAIAARPLTATVAVAIDARVGFAPGLTYAATARAPQFLFAVAAPAFFAKAATLPALLSAPLRLRVFPAPALFALATLPALLPAAAFVAAVFLFGSVP
jgi:hypothetical protein